MTLATRPTITIEPLLTPSLPSSSDGPIRGGRLPGVLGDAYGSDLWIPLRTDRPTLVANFVSSLDGVVSYKNPGEAGGAEISGFSEPDRFVMGLLRSLADAVLVGAGTVRDTPRHVWAPGYTHPASREAFAALRTQLRLAPAPRTVVVTAGGEIDLAQRGLAQPDVPVTIVTTDVGVAPMRRRSQGPVHAELVSTGTDRVEPTRLLELLHERGLDLVLCEGGPHLLGQLLGARLLDELFLTIAPQVAGRSESTPRLGLVEGTGFALADAPWFDLVDVRRSGDHLFTRYRSKGDQP